MTARFVGVTNDMRSWDFLGYEALRKATCGYEKLSGLVEGPSSDRRRVMERVPIDAPPVPLALPRTGRHCPGFASDCRHTGGSVIRVPVWSAVGTALRSRLRSI
jgi:hypothetical protein